MRFEKRPGSTELSIATLLFISLCVTQGSFAQQQSHPATTDYLLAGFAVQYQKSPNEVPADNRIDFDQMMEFLRKRHLLPSPSEPYSDQEAEQARAAIEEMYKKEGVSVDVKTAFLPTHSRRRERLVFTISGR